MPKKSKKKTPKGFTCPACKEFNEFSLWVYAHWAEVITGKCENCKRVYEFLAGENLGEV